MLRIRSIALAALLAALVPLWPTSAGATAAHAPEPASVPTTPTQVLVVGGTPAGIAAAISAARRGLRVQLVCSKPYLGGLLTGGMMDQWDLNTGPDGTPIQGGIFREIYERLGQAFEPRTAERVFLQMLEAYPSITLHLMTAPVLVNLTGAPPDRRIKSVTFVDERYGARFEIHAPITIDATDSGNLAAMAGARYDVGRQDTGLDEKMQAATLMFDVSGVDWEMASLSYDAERFGYGGVTRREIWGYDRLMRRYKPLSPQVIVRDLNLGHEPDGRVTVNAVDITDVDGRNAASLEHGMEIGRAEVRHLIPFLRANVPGFAHARLVNFADQLYIRETRHILGLTTLTAGDIWRGSIPYDTVGLASYPLDLHPSYVGEEPAYAPIRHVYGVPFRALVPYGFDNLLIVGPAISATHAAEGSVRTIPTTIEEGEAAGVAAAISLRHGVDFDQMAYRVRWIHDLRDALARAGAVIDVARR